MAEQPEKKKPKPRGKKRPAKPSAQINLKPTWDKSGKPNQTNR